MADIELVIKISEELYQAYKGRPPMLGDAGMDMIAQAIANGTPLPKGHGDLVDRSTIDMSGEYRNVSLSDKSLWIANGILNDSKVVIPAEQEVD